MSNDAVMIERELKISRPMPRQFFTDAIGEIVTKATDSLGDFLQGVLTLHISLSLMLNASVNQMLSFIKQMQITLTQALFRIPLSADATIFFSKFIAIVSFDPIDISEQIMALFGLDPDTVAFSLNFEAFGFETTYLLVNMGTLLPIIVVGVAYLVLLLVLTWCIRCSYFQKLRTYLRRIR